MEAPSLSEYLSCDRVFWENSVLRENIQNRPNPDQLQHQMPGK